MLILTRGVDEAFTIGSDIKIKILEINGTMAKVGIDAPRDIKILRTELEKREEE